VNVLLLALQELSKDVHQADGEICPVPSHARSSTV
jgi:hypothetical protein